MSLMNWLYRILAKDEGIIVGLLLMEIWRRILRIWYLLVGNVWKLRMCHHVMFIREQSSSTWERTHIDYAGPTGEQQYLRVVDAFPEKKTEQNHGLEYVKTHVRAASWLTGIALGYILHRVRQGSFKWTMSKLTTTLLWFVAVGMCVTSVYSVAPFQSLQYRYRPVVDSLHIALHRNLFSLGASGVILVCVCGRGVSTSLYTGTSSPPGPPGLYCCVSAVEEVSIRVSGAKHTYMTSVYSVAPFQSLQTGTVLSWTVSTSLYTGTSSPSGPPGLYCCVSAVEESLQYRYSPVVDSLHIALHRNLFSLGASGVILLCVCGRGGFVRDFLSWRGFQPLATLSYGVYLSHMGLQAADLASLRQPLAFDMHTLFTGYLSDLLLANFMAVLIFLLVEAPFWHIGNWLYNPNTGTGIGTLAEKRPENVNFEEEKSSL
ncbi:hypothetical protein J6590_070350 [Homalodisca vitripennis]|nr:hypothetical protein J6590_070350 [Homalodisca vitripennis]